MFRLFSLVRRRLLAENEAIKYIKYAVGEVLLIMIGILLAFGLESWWEDRKDARESDRIRVALIEEFFTAAEELSFQTSRNVQVIQACDTLLKAIDRATGQPLEVEVELIGTLLFTPTLDSRRGTLDGLITSADWTSSVTPPLKICWQSGLLRLRMFEKMNLPEEHLCMNNSFRISSAQGYPGCI